jgi:hypothetical protein
MYLQLSGRLGNQLFQWAYCHVLFQKYGVAAHLFMDKFHNDSEDVVKQLPKLPQCVHVKQVGVINSFGFILSIMDWLNSKLSRRVTYRFYGIFRSLDSFSLPKLPRRRPYLISGFFINSKSIEIFEDIIFQELSRHLDDISSITQLPTKYQVIHIRRGDFLTTDTSYGVLDSEYYASNVVSDLPIVLCTESSEECADVIQQLNPELILSSSNSTPWQTIKTIAGASHVVISNSTLSWWGGFMAAKRGSKVVIPRPFYLNSENLNVVFEFRLFSPETAIFKPAGTKST